MWVGGISKGFKEGWNWMEGRIYVFRGEGWRESRRVRECLGKDSRSFVRRSIEV